MGGRSSLTISKELGEKLKLIKEENYCASMNEVIESLIPTMVNEDLKFKREPPAFTLIAEEDVLNISFYELRHAQQGKTWNVSCDEYSECATLLYSDNMGAFVRFSNSEDMVQCKYYHYLK